MSCIQNRQKNRDVMNTLHAWIFFQRYNINDTSYNIIYSVAKMKLDFFLPSSRYSHMYITWLIGEKSWHSHSHNFYCSVFFEWFTHKFLLLHIIFYYFILNVRTEKSFLVKIKNHENSCIC